MSLSHRGAAGERGGGSAGPASGESFAGAALRRAGLVALGDKGYVGLDDRVVLTPPKGRDRPEPKKARNRLLAGLRAPGERALAQLKNWRILLRLRCRPCRAANLARAVAVVDQHEHKSR